MPDDIRSKREVRGLLAFPPPEGVKPQDGEALLRAQLSATVEELQIMQEELQAAHEEIAELHREVERLRARQPTHSVVMPKSHVMKPPQS